MVSASLGTAQCWGPLADLCLLKKLSVLLEKPPATCLASMAIWQRKSLADLSLCLHAVGSDPSPGLSSIQLKLAAFDIWQVLSPQQVELQQPHQQQHVVSPSARLWQLPQAQHRAVTCHMRKYVPIYFACCRGRHWSGLATWLLPAQLSACLHGLQCP